MQEKIIDLHIHPTGCWSYDQSSSGGPNEAIENWLRLEKEVILGITEHETVVSYEALLNEIKFRNLEKIIEIIPGVEASSVYRGSSNHILGYWLKQEDESLGDIIGLMLKASEDILITTSDMQYLKYAYPGRENVQRWRENQGKEDANRLTISLLEQVRDNKYPKYNFSGWRISPDRRPGSATLTGLNHSHIAEVAYQLGWVSNAKKFQKEFLERGRSLYPCRANGNDLTEIERITSTEKVVGGLYKTRCLVVFAHPQELIRMMAEEMIINELGYKKLVVDEEQQDDFKSREGIKYRDLSSVFKEDKRCAGIINDMVEEVWKLIRSLTNVGLRGVELYNRHSYRDEAMEYATQKLEIKISNYNETHTLTPLIITSGTDNHKGEDDKDNPPIGMLPRQRSGINIGWRNRNSYLERVDNTALKERVEEKPIEYSILASMREAKLDTKTGFYLLPTE